MKKITHKAWIQSNMFVCTHLYHYNSVIRRADDVKKALSDSSPCRRALPPFWPWFILVCDSSLHNLTTSMLFRTVTPNTFNGCEVKWMRKTVCESGNGGNAKEVVAPALADTVNKLRRTLFWGGRLHRALAGVWSWCQLEDLLCERAAHFPP